MTIKELTREHKRQAMELSEQVDQLSKRSPPEPGAVADLLERMVRHTLCAWVLSEANFGEIQRAALSAATQQHERS